jgi:hypothetical protein
MGLERTGKDRKGLDRNGRERFYFKKVNRKKKESNEY